MRVYAIASAFQGVALNLGYLREQQAWRKQNLVHSIILKRQAVNPGW